MARVLSSVVRHVDVEDEAVASAGTADTDAPYVAACASIASVHEEVGIWAPAGVIPVAVGRVERLVAVAEDEYVAASSS